MLYSRATGNGGTWVKYYQYDISPSNLIDQIKELKTTNKSLQPPNDTIMLGDIKAGYIHVKFYDFEKQNFYHTFIRIDTALLNCTEIVFYGASPTPNKEDAKIINRDYDLISKRLTINRFQDLVINRLETKPK